MAIVSGIVFLIASMLYSRMSAGNARPLAARHLLIVLMLLLTVISQFAISPKMHAIRAEVGVIDSVPFDNPLRREFDRLHVWSEKFEEAVLLLGLVAHIHNRASIQVSLVECRAPRPGQTGTMSHHVIAPMIYSLD